MRTIGLYVHIPFCVKKCYYCDFNSFETLELIPEYLEALRIEITNLKNCCYSANTVYIGGGTPTVLTNNQLFSLLSDLHKNIYIAKDAEITIEANPGTLTQEKLHLLKTLGVNRLSIGLQAYQNSMLKIMGRIHTVEDFENNFITARDIGFNNINVDLIFGLPNQRLEDFEETLRRVSYLSPEHISCYALSVEEGTKFHQWKQEGRLSLPSDDDERKMYYEAIEALTRVGYNHYEISNFAKPVRECKHNLVYWTYKDYLGLGAGAHSFLDNKRFNNHPIILDYIKSIKNSSTAILNIESISYQEQQAAFCIMGLRLLQGLNKAVFKQRFHKEITQVYKSPVEKLKKQGLLQENSENLKLTALGLDFANVVFMEFLP
ncbi:MAG: oxygen-independent coproporphyrinogen III oxidase [Thermoanaerobacteraceae bacterium]|nr:oxygen-independent coproporphyrinogen III oxidase [Thermoanaerobacteraceae bacterium]